MKSQNDREVIANWNGTGRTGTVLRCSGRCDQVFQFSNGAVQVIMEADIYCLEFS